MHHAGTHTHTHHTAQSGARSKYYSLRQNESPQRHCIARSLCACEASNKIVVFTHHCAKWRTTAQSGARTTLAHTHTHTPPRKVAHAASTTHCAKMRVRNATALLGRSVLVRPPTKSWFLLLSSPGKRSGLVRARRAALRGIIVLSAGAHCAW